MKYQFGPHKNEYSKKYVYIKITKVDVIELIIYISLFFRAASNIIAVKGLLNFKLYGSVGAVWIVISCGD